MKLYNGDCLEIMQSIEDKSIDMILCDLPYGTTQCSWDIVIPFEKLWEQYNRICKPIAAICLFGIEPFASHLRLSNLDNYKYDWYWQKERLTNIVQVKKRPGKVIETISVFYQDQPMYNPEMKIHNGPKRTNKIKNGTLGILIDGQEKRNLEYNDTGYRFPIQIVQFQRDILKSNLHPTQKPVALCEYLIKTYTNENMLVLDNCAGSGTTGIACLNTNRNFILIEKDLEYFNISENRIREHILNA